MKKKTVSIVKEIPSRNFFCPSCGSSISNLTFHKKPICKACQVIMVSGKEEAVIYTSKRNEVLDAGTGR